MALDTTGIIFLASFIILYGVFLGWDFFRRGERWGYLAYIMALIPPNILWGSGIDVLVVYILLFSLWIGCLLRDLFLVYGKTKEYDDILTFLGLGILVQVILAGILPNMNTIMQTNCSAWWVFWFPDVYHPSTNAINSWVNSSYLLGFRLAATMMIILAILPMILDLKNSDEHINILAIIIIDGIFILPFLWLAYIWGGSVGLPLTFLFAVMLFIILLLLTKEK